MEPTIERDHRADEAGRCLGQYDLLLDGVEIGELTYRDHAGVRTFTHTGVRPDHEGRGYGALLVERGLADARADGVRIVPRCSFVARYVDQHPEQRDLLAADR